MTNHKIVNSRGSYFGQSRREMLEFFDSHPGVVLEVGCGEGHFAALLKEHFEGAVVWGVEPVASAHAGAVQRVDHAILGSFDASLNLPQAHFDTIVFNDSLEHLADEVAAVRLALSLLKPSGRIIASIPNVRCWTNVCHLLLEADWKYESAGILDRTHLRFFTRRSIERLCATEGLQVAQLQGINPCWTGFKFKALRAVAPRLTADMEFEQFALVARRATAADRPA